MNTVGTPRPDTEPDAGDVEALTDGISGWPIGSGYYSTSIGIDDARDIARDVLAALPDLGYSKADPTRPNAGPEPEVVAGGVRRDEQGQVYEAWVEEHQAETVTEAFGGERVPLVTLADALAYAARQQQVGVKQQ